MTIRLDGVQVEQRLHDVSCEIGVGITLLIGRIGAGKSSLLDVMTGLQKPASGSVRYEGKPLWEGKRVVRELQNSIGVVFQSPEQQLFARSVEAEFAYSLKPLGLSKAEVMRRTLAALEAMGLPEGLLSQAPLTLSGGQKRRVALGTTLAVEPRWLFLDEPTAGLDPQSTAGLIEWCKSWAASRADGALVIATHDLDAFFPIADRVLVVQDGRLVADATPQELCEEPQLLEQAGIGLPESLQTVRSLRRHGFDLPAGPLSPEELAERIAGQVRGQRITVGAVSDDVPPMRLSAAERAGETSRLYATGCADGTSVGAGTDSVTPELHGQADFRASSTVAVLERPEVAVDPEVDGLSASMSEREAESALPLKPLVHRLDPRGKWVFYVALSIGLLMQTTWAGLLTGTVLTLAVLWVSQTSYRELFRVTKPFLWFLAFSVVLSGLKFSGGIGFDMDKALYTFRQVYKVLLVLILGVLLSATTGQLRMKRALEQALAPLARLKIPVEAFALAVSLMLRFIPVILGELQRFSRITRARGRSNARLGGLRVRDIPVLVIPLLLSVLQLGEELSLAMEARGYGSFGGRRTSSMRLQMRSADWWTMGLGLVLLLLLSVF